MPKAIEETENILLFSHFVMERAPYAVFWIDAAARIHRVNETACKWLGYTAEELLSMTIHDLNPDYPPHQWKNLWKRLKREKVLTFETRQRKNNGEFIPVEVTSNFFEFEGKEFTCSFARDITDRKLAEQAVRESGEETFRLMFTNNPIPMWVFDEESLKFLAVNDAAVRHYGYSREEFLNLTIKDIRPSEEVSSLLGYLSTERPERKRVWEWMHRKKDGTTIFVKITSYGLQFAGRKARLVLADIITERKQAEEKLRQYAKRLEIMQELDRAILSADSPRAISDAALDHLQQLVPYWQASVALIDFAAGELTMIALRTHGNTVYDAGMRWPLEAGQIPQVFQQGEVHVEKDYLAAANPPLALNDLIKEGLRSGINVPLVAREQLIGALNLGLNRPGAFKPEHIDIAREVADMLAIAIQQARLYEQVKRHATELEQRVAERTRELSNINSELKQEITERKQAEAALKESEQRLSLLLESAMDAIIVLNEDRRVVLMNPAAEKILRCSVSEIVDNSFDPFLSREFRELLSNYIKNSHDNRISQPYIWAPENLNAFRTDGEKFPVEATLSQFEMSGQKLFTIILRDINERQQAEAQLQKLQLEKTYLQEEIKTAYNFEEIVGVSPVIKGVFDNIKSVAGTDSTVLIIGETGTGKELVARAIHNRSARKDKVLVKVNCAALPGGLIESEFFGHEKGAFTGALSQKIGRFELANNGTIFLDEIADLPLELQAKLLRVLQEGEFERVGGAETIKINVRVIAATNQKLEKLIEEGSFREDLFYRLNVFPIHIPPLRKRRQDIPPLVRHFIMQHGMKLGKKIDQIPKRTMDTLVAYSWPGNVRELGNVIERAMIISKGGKLELGNWLEKPDRSSNQTKVPTLEELEKKHILKVLEKTGWRVSGEKGAAKILGMKHTTLASRMKKLGIQREK